MIGIVIVSHSARLAEGVVELAEQVAHGKVRLAAAGGTGNAEHPIGTDAFRVQEAIEQVFSEDGVLVFMDLGSAVLSAETALEFLDEARRARVRLCPGPLVESAMAAASLASAGGTFDEVANGAVQRTEVEGQERTVTIGNKLGLHARPAARLIRLVRRFDARVAVANVSAGTGPCNAASLNGLLALRGRQGDRLRFSAAGSQADEVLTALQEFAAAGFGDSDTAPPVRDNGIGASAGVAMGPLLHLRHEVAEVPKRQVEDPDAEWVRLQSALSAAREETGKLSDPAGIFDAQALLLEDPELIDAARSQIFAGRYDAAFAWQSAAEEFIGRLRALDDSYLKERAADLSDVAARVLLRLTGESERPMQIAQPSIIAAHDLTPSQVEKLDPSLVLGVCLETGSASAHSAILARARGIPAVVGLGTAVSIIPDGTRVALDGESGRFWVDPPEEEQRDIEERRRKWLARHEASSRGRLKPATTRDGRRITVLCNLSRESEAADVVEYGGEGVGVLRTEFLFLNRKTAPTEEEQFAAYRNIAATLGERPLVIRTLDIGGDKGVSYVDVGEEANPFLGWRGVRLTLGCRSLFETQIRAILRAGVAHRVEILLPMISTVDELREVKGMVRGIEEQLRLAVPMPVGVMIEVPAAAMMAEQLASEASRLSIGTNDLVQYIMAADRTNARVAGIADSFQPAVLRAIRDVVQAGRKAGVRVDVCGEMAADPLAVPVLVGLGVEELSVSPPLVPGVKAALARWTQAQAEGIANRALEMESSAAVRQMLRDQAP